MKCYRDVYKKTSMDFTMICRVILGVATFKYSQDYDKYTVESIIKLLLNKYPDALTSLTPFLDILLELAKLYPCFKTSGIKPPREHFQMLGQDHFIG